MEYFNQHRICCEGNTKGYKQCRFLEFLEDNFFVKAINQATRGDAILNLLLINNKEDVKVEGKLGCVNHEIVEFKILREDSKASTRITILVLRRIDFSLVRDQRCSWQDIMGNCTGGQRGLGLLLIFKNKFLKAQEWSFLMCRKQA